MVLESFSTVLLIAGGSGISFVLAAIQQLHNQAALGQSRVQLVEVIWAVQTAGALIFFTSACEQNESLTCNLVRVHRTDDSLFFGALQAGRNYVYPNHRSLYSDIGKTLQLQRRFLPPRATAHTRSPKHDQMLGKPH